MRGSGLLNPQDMALDIRITLMMKIVNILRKMKDIIKSEISRTKSLLYDEDKKNIMIIIINGMQRRVVCRYYILFITIDVITSDL